MSKSKVIYSGPSRIDGAPIVVVAVPASSNTKTGAMLQTYILRKDINPLEANKTGADYSICGDCKLRGKPTNDPNKKQATERGCYVLLGQGPLNVWRSYNRGIYGELKTAGEIADFGAGAVVRLGTYGDPAAVPNEIWDALLRRAVSHTGYSHQGSKGLSDFSRCMVSADNLEQARDAWAIGNRTFRVISDISEVDRKNEILCPASREAGYRTTCKACKLCGGNKIRAKSVAIVKHGSGAKYA